MAWFVASPFGMYSGKKKQHLEIKNNKIKPKSDIKMTFEKQLGNQKGQ